jgi:hypothetical protein
MLSLQLAAMRFDPVTLAGMLLCGAGLAAWLWILPGLKDELKQQQQALQQIQFELDHPTEHAVTVRDSQAHRLENFYATLGEKDYAEQQVKTLFAIAAKSDLRLDQGEYKWSFDSGANFYSYQITLPVKGSYLSIRKFCDQVLLAIPFVSLDEIGFKREAIANSALEAKLRFTLYLQHDSARSVSSSGPAT